MEAPEEHGVELTLLAEAADDLELESELVEYKAVLHLIDSPHQRAEFAKDLIAMANSARRRGKPGYILYGVRDPAKARGEDEFLSGEDQIVAGIGAGDVHLKRNGPALDDPARRDAIDRDLHAVAQNCIDPNPHWEFVAHSFRGKSVAWAKVYPASANAFRLKKELKRSEGQIWRDPFPKGTGFIRNGGAVGSVVPECVDDLDCWQEVPYVEARQWSGYAARCKAVFSVDEARTLAQLSSMDSSASWAIPLLAAVDQFIASDDRLLWIVGGPGSGKTVFLQMLAATLAGRAPEVYDAAPGTQEARTARPWIPVFLSLRDGAWTGTEQFADCLANEIDGLYDVGIGMSRRPGGVFKSRQLPLVILLDAWDELDRRGVPGSRRAIRGLTGYSPNSKIIITSRPSAVPCESRAGEKRVHICRLDQSEIERCLVSSVTIDSHLSLLLRDYPELRQFLALPLVLHASIEWNEKIENAPTSETLDEGESLVAKPLLADLLDSVVGRLLEHDRGKRVPNVGSMDDLVCLASLQNLAWAMDGELTDYPVDHLRGFPSSSPVRKRDVDRAMDLQLLMPLSLGESTHIKFSEPFVKARFAVRKCIDLAASQKARRNGRLTDWLRVARANAAFWELCRAVGADLRILSDDLMPRTRG